MATASACPECGETIGADAPMGVCPRCLLGPMVGPEASHAHRAPAVGAAPTLPGLEILGRVGQGGMGTVYKARQVGLDRPVAVKVIRPDLAFEPAFAERFRREARAMARLNHPNIVTFHDSGEAGGVFYFVMEFVEGGDLRRALGRGPLTTEAALVVALQVADALQDAHEQGVVHRDIKPENVLRDRRGRVKIADFGLAKLLELPAGEASLTATRQFLGTPAYVAPEMFAALGKVDHRADIYALGVLLYEMLTDRLPLGRYDLPSEIVGTDEELDEILSRALQGDPAKRYQSVAELRSELATYIEDNGLELAMPPAEAAPVVEDQSEIARLTKAKGEAEGCAGVSLVLLLFVAPIGLFNSWSGLTFGIYLIFLFLVFALFAVGFGLGFWSALRLDADWRAERRGRHLAPEPEPPVEGKPEPFEGMSTLGPRP